MKTITFLRAINSNCKDIFHIKKQQREANAIGALQKACVFDA